VLIPRYSYFGWYWLYLNPRLQLRIDVFVYRWRVRDRMAAMAAYPFFCRD
jgi:hypothetical protein